MLKRIRDNAHPLHRLRSSKVFSERVLPHLDFTVRTRITDVDWPVYVNLMRNFSYVVGGRLLEPGTTALVDVLIARYRPRSFWDVGANIGFYSWLFLSKTQDGRALLLEPEPDNLALLEKTIRQARLQHATCLAVAASDAVGKDSFQRDPVSGATGGLASAGESFITRHYGIEPPRLEVATTTLDALASEHTPPDLIKIDVEGAEDAVLRGADNLLSNGQPIVLFELASRNSSEVLKLFEGKGYAVHPSSTPDAVATEGPDFVALPGSIAGEWDDLCRQWRERLTSYGG